MSTHNLNTNYGTRCPDAIEKHSDLVVINTNIREVPYLDTETGETVMTYIADAQMMTYQEYSSVQDKIIAREASANAEQDELIALILEGGF